VSTPKGAVKDRPALREANHVHDAVAAELGIDPDRLLAEIADGTAARIKWERA
jgi:hypothetical protein